MSSLTPIGTVLANDFPKTFEMRDGVEATMRPLARGDAEALIDFFRRIPAEEQGRFFRDPVTDPIVVAQWCASIDPTGTFSLLVLDGERIVADCTLHCYNSRMKHHVGELRLSVEPDYRYRGVGSTVVSEMLDLAPHLGLRWVDVEVSTNESDAIEFLEHMRFTRHGVLPEHAEDGLGGVYDIILMARYVGRDEDVIDIGGEG